MGSFSDSYSKVGLQGDLKTMSNAANEQSFLPVAVRAGELVTKPNLINPINAQFENFKNTNNTGAREPRGELGHGKFGPQLVSQNPNVHLNETDFANAINQRNRLVAGPQQHPPIGMKSFNNGPTQEMPEKTLDQLLAEREEMDNTRPLPRRI